MSVMQNYGVLRVVRGNHGSHEEIAGLGSSMSENVTDRGQGQGQALPLRERIRQRYKYLGRWIPEERLAYVLSQRETTIGRALSSDIILLDPTVSRDHARLVLSEQGWSVWNLTENNVVRVNDHIVEGGEWAALQPQDLLMIGDTTLQLVAPSLDRESSGGVDDRERSNGDEREQVPLPVQYPQIGWGEREPHSAVPADAGNTNGTMPTERRVHLRSFRLVLSRHMRRIFIIGGLLSIVVVVGVLLVLSSLNKLSGSAPGGTYSLMLALVVPLIPALGINVLVTFIDRYRRAPWFLRLAAFLWGAIIAIPPALFIEDFIDGFITHLWGLDSQVLLHACLSALDAGVTEETVKGLGLLLLFFVLRDEFDNITDGIVYGALIGAGFAMVENSFYFLRNSNDLSVFILGRIVLGWLSHSTFTICVGVALGSIRHTHVRWRQCIIPLLGCLLAVCLHTIFDFVNIFVRDMVPTYGNSLIVARLAILAVVVNYIPPFIAQVSILYILIQSLMHEAAVIREFLPSEVAEGVITVDEYAMLPHSFARTGLERQVLWRYGIREWLLTRALYQTEIRLAFCKWHISMGDKPRRGYLQPEVVYRKRIKRIRQEMAVLVAKRDCAAN